MEREKITKIVDEVLSRLERSSDFKNLQAKKTSSAEKTSFFGGIFNSVDSAVKAVGEAQREFQEMGLEKRGRIISAIRKASVANAERLAKMACEETGMGRWQDKLQKNLLVAEKTPGIEDLNSKSYTGDKGLTLVEYAPFGVISAITPSTNPTATVISNAIGMLAGGNGVVFSPHPASKNCVHETIRILNAAIVLAGGPENLVATISQPSQEATTELLSHPDTRLNLVTGGPAIVNVAMTTGKVCKTIAAGPGNPPVVVDETAVFPKCAEDIIYGCGFDNNVLCIAEKEVIVVESVREKLLNCFRKDARAFELTRAQLDQLCDLAIRKREGSEPVVSREFVGKNASYIAKKIGLNLSDDVRVLWAEVPNDHILVTTEQLMPVLPVTSCPDVDSAIMLAKKVEGGNNHTCAMYSTHVGNMTKMGRVMACSIFVKNSPTLYGLGMGEGYASMSIGTPTGDGITKPSHFVRPLHCALSGYFRIV
jgi:propionaldehyde dehydrogenase